MAILTTSQYSTVLSKGTSLIFSLGPTGVTAAINKASTVLSNNLMPFFNQLSAYTVKNKARGLTEKACRHNGFRVVNSFASKKRINTIYTRVSLQFTSKEWTAIVNALRTIVQFSKFGW
jgi:hypothetical protein